MRGVLALSLALATLAAGCAHQLRTKSERRAYSLSVKDLRKVEQAYTDRQRFYQRLRSRAANARLEPYPQMEALLADMQRALRRAGQAVKGMENLRREFEYATRNKKRVTVQDPSWTALEEMASRRQKTRQDFSIALDEAENQAQQFDEKVSKHQVRQLPLGPYKRRVGELGRESDRLIQRIRIGLSEAEKLVSSESEPLWRRQAGQKLKALMKDSASAERAHEDFDRARLAFEKESQGTDLIWEGPGIHTKDQVEIMEESLVRLKKAQQSFAVGLRDLREMAR